MVCPDVNTIRDDTDVILIDRVQGRPCRYHHLEFSLHAGSRIPAYCSATGKALLAFMAQPDLADQFGPLLHGAARQISSLVI